MQRRGHAFYLTSSILISIWMYINIHNTGAFFSLKTPNIKTPILRHYYKLTFKHKSLRLKSGLMGHPEKKTFNDGSQQYIILVTKILERAYQ